MDSCLGPCTGPRAGQAHVAFPMRPCYCVNSLLYRCVRAQRKHHQRDCISIAVSVVSSGHLFLAPELALQLMHHS